MGPTEKILADIDKHTPKTGYNLCGIDDFEPAGQQLYTIAHFETSEQVKEANKARPDALIYPNVGSNND